MTPGLIVDQGKPIHIWVHPTTEYLGDLARFLRKSGWPWKGPFRILARAFIDTPGRDSIITFRGQRAARDERLGAHELGHARGLEHTADETTIAGAWKLLTNRTTWTTMHPWGAFRRTDPEGLLEAWREAVGRDRLAGSSFLMSPKRPL